MNNEYWLRNYRLGVAEAPQSATRAFSSETENYRRARSVPQLRNCNANESALLALGGVDPGQHSSKERVLKEIRVSLQDGRPRNSSRDNGQCKMRYMIRVDADGRGKSP